MATISQSEIKPIYTTLIAAKYDEMQKIKATGFLRSFFPDNVTKVRYPSIDVRRGSEKVAADVALGHQGNRNQVTHATQKILDLFYYREYFDATELDCYWNLFGSTSISENIMTEFVDGIANANKAMQDKIDRAYELLCAEVLEFGTCTSLTDGSVVNFKRKSGSFVDLGSGNYWDVTGHDVYADLGAGGTFIRKYGKYTGGIFNAILGEDALSALLNNSTVKDRNTIKMWKLDDVLAPQMKAEGMTYHGTLSCGPYEVHLWAYPQYYEDATNANALTPYVNPKKVVMLPTTTTFETIYGATPQLITPGQATASLVSGKYILSDYINPKKRTHEFHIESRGIPVPIAVDTIYTVQVLAD